MQQAHQQATSARALTFSCFHIAMLAFGHQVERNGTVAWRRRQRQLRAWHRHERRTVQMELTRTAHHRSQLSRVDTVDKDLVGGREGRWEEGGEERNNFTTDTNTPSRGRGRRFWMLPVPESAGHGTCGIIASNCKFVLLRAWRLMTPIQRCWEH